MLKQFSRAALPGLAIVIAAFLLSGCEPQSTTPAKAPEAAPPQAPARSSETSEQTVPLIKRTTFFGKPVQYQGRISPDGAKVSWLALSEGALNLFVADVGSENTPRQYTFGKDGVEIHRWTPNSAYILYARAFSDTKTTRVFALNVQTGAVRDLVPVNPGDNVWLKGVSKNWPNAALVRLRRKGADFFDLYRVDLVSGQKIRITQNNGYKYWVTDSDFMPRIGIRTNADKSQTWDVIAQNGQAKPLLKVRPADIARTWPLQMDATSTSLYMIDGRNREFSALERLDLQTGERQILAIGQDGDIENALFHPITAAPLAYFTNGPYPHWQALSADFQPVLDRLSHTLGPRFFILAATNTAEQIVTYSDRPEHPGVYSLYDLQSNTITTLFETVPALERQTLATSRLMTLKARDGFSLITYFTKAQTENPASAPLVVIPQPWINSRNYYGFDPRIQWLSNRGYNVLEVNTRGAKGLGQTYAKAGTGRGILQAKTDLADAVRAIVGKGLADPDRIAGFGWDNGGRTLLNLAALTDTPLQCALVLDPYIDINDMLARAIKKGDSARLTGWVSGPKGQIDPQLLRAISPAAHTDTMKARTLVLQGNANKLLDPKMSYQYVRAVRAAGGKAALVRFSDISAKQYSEPEFIPFAALAENFLADCLGGKAEPIGDALNLLTFEVNAGPQGVPGLDLSPNPDLSKSQ
jgi:dipeptidyl aminopeptidase/acylaminoacyl peptidase